MNNLNSPADKQDFIFLSYRVKLYPSRVKSDLLALLCDLYRREHHKAIDFCDSVVAKEGTLFLKGKSQAGEGAFKHKVRRRAVNDYRKARKAAKALKKQMQLPYLKAELSDLFEVRTSRKATEFDLWIHAEDVRLGRGLAKKEDSLWIPAKKHKALNRALEKPGATLRKSAQVFRKNGEWYAWIYVRYPVPPAHKPQKWIGVDVGLRAAVTRSDGYSGPDLRPILAKQKARRAARQKNNHYAGFGLQTPQKQAIAIEAKKLVSVALASSCGIAIEDPKRLPRYNQWAGRFLARRLEVLAPLAGVPVRLVHPPYTSLTCSRCGSRDTFRHKTMFRCLACGHTQNADFNASRNIRQRASLLRSAENG